MIKQQKLEELIREKVILGNCDSRGFHSLKCPVCSDYKPRGGFKFDDNKVIYNCFNCSKGAVFEEGSERISRSMRAVLNGLDIDDDEISAVTSSSFFNRKEETTKITLDSLVKVNTHTPPVKFPLTTFQVGACLDHFDQQAKIVEYLESRKVDLDKYKFYFSPIDRFQNKVIVPYYRSGQLIYWQARSVDPLADSRYDNAAVSREAVIFNFDQLYRFTPAPLFVCEGAFDAMMFDGIAILGSKLSAAKIELLNQSKRRLVFVIDKDKNGKKLAEHVLSLGWEITFAPDGAEDINKAVQRFGKSWTALQLMKNIPKDMDSAALSIGLNCGS